MKRKVLGALFATILILATSAAATATNSDTALQGSWAQTTVMKAEKNGLLDPADSVKPDEFLTRADFADMLTRAYGAFVNADMSAYIDIVPESGTAAVMAKAVGMGAFKGSGGKLFPDTLITREAAFVALTRVLRIGAQDDSMLQKFSDSALVSPWARTAAASLVSNGYIVGSGGQLRPLSPITRGEAAQLFDNLFKAYLNQPGTYTSVPEGNIMINVPGVILKDVTVRGMIVVGDGVGEGNCTLENVKTISILMVRGGGPHTVVAGRAAVEGEETTVTLLPDSDGGTGQITITNAGGSIVLNSNNLDTHIVTPSNLQSPPTLVAFSGGILSGSFGSVLSYQETPPPLPPSAKPLPGQQPTPPPPPSLDFQNATVGQLNIHNPGTAVNLNNASVTTLNVDTGASGSSVNVGPGGSVSTITANAPTSVTGPGTVGSVTAGPGVSGVTTGGQPVPPGSSYNPPPPVPTLSASVQATGANKLRVHFNLPVDSAAAVFTVKKGLVSKNFSSVSWSNNEAEIALASNLSSGDYTVTITGLSETLSATVTAQDEKVDSIEFTSAFAVLDRLDASNKTTIVRYKIENQYGEDATAQFSPDMSFVSSGGIAGPPVNGIIKFTDITAHVADDKITVSAVDSNTGTFGSSVLTVVNKATVASVEISGLFNADGLTPTAGDPAESYYIVLSLKDQYNFEMPNSVENLALEASDIIGISSDTEVADFARVGGSPYDATPILSTKTIDGVIKTVIQLDPTSMLGRGTAVLTIISKSTGYLAHYNFVVQEAEE